jgi:dTDP-4-dehydrorhamnose reductase
MSIREIKPAIIINAAAYTDVDRAESDLDSAIALNVTAPSTLAIEAEKVGATLVHYSSDYVFDGSGNGPWREDDPAEALNVYGQTKREGELAIEKSGCDYLIFRTSWVYSAGGRNFIRTILRLAAERDILQLVDDQWGAPTSAELIADTTVKALHHCLAQRQDLGLYHLAAGGETTWFNYANYIISAARDAGWTVCVTDDAIYPVSSDAFQTAARRPHNSRLDTSRLESVFGLKMPDWRIGVDRVLTEIFSCDELLRED